MKNFFTIIIFTVLSATVFAQKYPDMGLYKVRINDTDKNVVAEINPVETEISLQTDRFYYWYSSNKIKITQGAYSGKLLNGQYSEFYNNKNLKEQGTFNRGLKHETWKSWNDKGILTQTETWDNGIKHGPFFIYDENGNVKQAGTYANNVLNGKVTNYNNSQITEVIAYKDGKVVPAKPKTKFWDKINIFKKKKPAEARKP